MSDALISKISKVKKKLTGEMSINHQMTHLRNQNRLIYEQLESYMSIINFLHPRYLLPPMRNSAISPDFARILIDEILTKKPKCVLECGSGVSTIINSYCIELNNIGKIYSLDDDHKYAEITRNNINKHLLNKYSEIYTAPLKQYSLNDKKYMWYDISSIKEIKDIDLLIIDGPNGEKNPDARFPALPLLYDKLSNNSTIIIDDANRFGEKMMVDKWLEMYKDFEYSFFPTEKGTVILEKKQAN